MFTLEDILSNSKSISLDRFQYFYAHSYDIGKVKVYIFCVSTFHKMNNRIIDKFIGNATNTTHNE